LASKPEPFIVSCPTCQAVVVKVEPEGLPKLHEPDTVALINHSIANHAISHMEVAMGIKYTLCPASDINVQLEQVWMQILDILVNKLHQQPEYAKELVAEASGRKVARGAVTVRKATKETTGEQEVKMDIDEVKRRTKEKMEAMGLSVEDDSKEG
jgi:hypothetical protein